MSNAELEKAANQVLVPLDGNYTTLYDNVLAEDHFKHVIIGTWVFVLFYEDALNIDMSF
jgi:hypothetical protein